MFSAFSAVLLLMAAFSAQSNATRIHATIAIEMKAACADAVGFVVEAGAAADSDKVRARVQDKSKANHPQVRNFSHADNFAKDNFLGSHAVVVTAANTKPGCATRAMGVGFGKDETTARKDAERRMGMLFPFHGRAVKVEFNQAF